MDVFVFARHPGGGIRTYIYYVYSHQAFNGTDIALLTPETDAMDSLLSEMDNVGRHLKVSDGIYQLFFGLCAALIKNRPQLLHSHGFTAGLLAAIPARILGIPHVITTHDVFREEQFPGWRGALKRRLIGRILSMATILNPVGRDAAANLQENYVYLGRKGLLTSIRNGINTRQFLVDDSRDVRSEAGLDGRPVLVGFFGRFMAQKGFKTLVDAVERWNFTQDQPLHVACFGWGGFIREEQVELNRRELSGYFHFFPGTDSMAAALRGVDVVVIPSRWEACPLLPMEAMVAGVPVIASRCIGLKEVTEDTPALTFEVESVEGLLECLVQVVANQEEIKAQAESFRAEAARRFDVDKTARELKELFLRVLER